MALDSIGTPTVVEEIPHSGRTFWVVTGIDSDVSTAIEIKAAPGAGKSLYLTSVTIVSDDADAHPHLQDEDGNILYGPIPTTNNGFSTSQIFVNPIKLVTNKALEIKAVAAGNVSIFVEGAIATV